MVVHIGLLVQMEQVVHMEVVQAEQVAVVVPLVLVVKVLLFLHTMQRHQFFIGLAATAHGTHLPQQIGLQLLVALVALVYQAL